MLNVNAAPTMIARIPIMMLNAENPLSINAIPKNTKLNPIRTVNAIELNIGQIMKINPKITATIPAAWFCSIFFPPKICFVHFFK